MSVSILTVSLVLSTSAHAEQWFRMRMDAPIFYGLGPVDDGGVPDLGGSNPIEFLVNGAGGTSADGRDLGDLNIPIAVMGIEAGHTVDVVDLPSGATWSGSAILWSPAIAGTYTPTIEVRDAEDTLVASQTIELKIHLALTASIPQTVYEVQVGEDLTITPTVQNAIGGLQWGSTPSDFPDWLSFDSITGDIEVDTAQANSLAGISLTGVDQFDLSSAATEQFSVTVHPDLIQIEVTPAMVTGSTLYLQDLFTPAQWTDPNLHKRVVIPAALEVGSLSGPAVAVASTSTTTDRWGGQLSMEVLGTVSGHGGAPYSGAGGDAIHVNLLGSEDQKLSIINYGTIRAGGGGGGLGGIGGEGSQDAEINPSAVVGNNDPNFGMGIRDMGAYFANVWIRWQGADVVNTIVEKSEWGGRITKYADGWSYSAPDGWHYRSMIAWLQQPGTPPTNWYTFYRYQLVAMETSGGGAGEPGRGQGFEAAATTGAPPVAGGVGAGASGRSGNGGAWGVEGQAGENGSDGNVGDGGAGSPGGLAGFYLSGSERAEFTNLGVVLGRLN